MGEKKVFVVDDEEQIAEVLTESLRAANFDVEMFSDPRSALMRASDCPPDVLVSDISMPEMDGIALAKALRERNPHCKVILISGNPKWKTHTQTLKGAGSKASSCFPSLFQSINFCISSNPNRI
jgi:DNA-binding NtrC family response regulator